MLKSVLFILFSLSLFSCGTSTDEKLKEVILDAQIALGSSNCQYAIDVLESYGRQARSAVYLKTLASAYACRAGYSTPTFFTSDLPLTSTHAPLGGTTIYSTSGVTVTNPLQDDTSFVDLQTAINILLYAGGISSTTNPTTTERAKYFTSDEAGEINSQLLFMELVQLGKYMRVYGNGSATGLKASGVPAGNKCFTDYTSAHAGVFGTLVAANGTCKVNNSPHTQLAASLAAATRKTRLCHGVVLANGMFDVIPSVVGAATGGSLSAASGITTAITALKAAVTGADSTTTNVFATINQTKCEDNGFVTVGNIETYFAGMMEYLFL